MFRTAGEVMTFTTYRMESVVGKEREIGAIDLSSSGLGAAAGSKRGPHADNRWRSGRGLH